MVFDKFDEMEYKTFIKNLEYFDIKTRKEEICLKLYIDLYNLKDYSYYQFNKLVDYLTGRSYPTLDNVKIFFNKNNTSYILKAMAYVNNMNQKNFRMDIIDIEKPKKWH